MPGSSRRELSARGCFGYLRNFGSTTWGLLMVVVVAVIDVVVVVVVVTSLPEAYLGLFVLLAPDELSLSRIGCRDGP